MHPILDLQVPSFLLPEITNTPLSKIRGGLFQRDGIGICLLSTPKTSHHAVRDGQAAILHSTLPLLPDSSNPKAQKDRKTVSSGSHLIPLHLRTRMEDLFHSHPLFLATPRSPEAPRMLGQSFMLRNSYSKGRDNSGTLSTSSLMEETQLTPSLTLYMSTPEHRNGEKGWPEGVT